VKNITIKQYTSDYYSLWNEFVAKAKNATFLFHRDFMEYHQDRFQDFSLLIFEDEKLVSILPANRVGDTLFSHQGLTYGGFVLNDKMLLSDSIEVLKKALMYLNINGIKTLNLKLIPTIYHKLPSSEIDYILFLLEAKLNSRDSIAIVDLEHKLPISRIRKRGIEKGIKNELILKEVDTFDEFWNEILIPNLENKYQAKPVHSLDEITYLKSKFPKFIKQYNVYHKTKIVAGITVFEKGKVIHPQYVSGNEKTNNELGSLDFLYNHLINEIYKDKKYFDFGPSSENQGKKLNESLHYFKESFGARTINQDFYEVKTANFSLLENVLV
tara:strand:- start:35230 stop:36210 length:981 start_codon:yes stop_codon:yes gene_type:complete